MREVYPHTLPKGIFGHANGGFVVARNGASLEGEVASCNCCGWIRVHNRRCYDAEVSLECTSVTATSRDSVQKLTRSTTPNSEEQVRRIRMHKPAICCDNLQSKDLVSHQTIL